MKFQPGTELARLVAAEHSDIVLDAVDLADPVHRAAVIAASDLPSNMGDMLTSPYLLLRAVRERSTVALSGESADEVFGGYLWFHRPELVDADAFPWHAGLIALTGRGLTEPALNLLAPDLIARLDLPGFRDAAYRQALSEVDHLPDEDPLERRMRDVCHLHLTRFLQIMLDRKDRMSMAHGREVRVPFCDHRLVEYVYNTSWRMKSFDGREKSALRAATADLVPESVRQRRKSPYPSTQDPRYELALRDGLRAVLADPGSPVRPLLDGAHAKAIAERDATAAPLGYERYAIETVLSLDGWLRRYPVRLLLG